MHTTLRTSGASAHADCVMFFVAVGEFDGEVSHARVATILTVGVPENDGGEAPALFLLFLLGEALGSCAVPPHAGVTKREGCLNPLDPCGLTGADASKAKDVAIEDSFLRGEIVPIIALKT